MEQDTLHRILTTLHQTYSNTEDRATSFLRDWHHLCSDRRAITLRQRSGEVSGSSKQELEPGSPQYRPFTHTVPQVQEIALDYSDCLEAPSTFTEIPSGKVSTYFKSSNCTKSITPQWKLSSRDVDYSPYGKTLNRPICSLQFTIPDNIGPPVLFYYRLTNFYQNHRRYVKSLDTNQLSGAAVPASTIKKGSCDPLRLGPNGKPYYPCGLIANSFFNDTFFNPILTNVRDSPAGNMTYNMTNKGIAWNSDKSLYGETKYSFDDIEVPPNWKERWPDGYTQENPPPDLSNYEEFQVWMRTAGLPAFSKLALRNDKETMPCGTYQADIALSTVYIYPAWTEHQLLTCFVDFPVTRYGGTKSIVISTRTVMGGKNPFLGIAYIVVGGICIVLGALFTVTHLIKPRSVIFLPSDMWRHTD